METKVGCFYRNGLGGGGVTFKSADDLNVT